MNARCDGALWIWKIFQDQLTAIQPFLIGVRGRQFCLQLVITDDPTFFQIDQQHLAGLQAPLLGDGAFFRRQYAHFRRHHHIAIVGDVVACRAKAVPIKGRPQFDGRL